MTKVSKFQQKLQLLTETLILSRHIFTTSKLELKYALNQHFVQKRVDTPKLSFLQVSYRNFTNDLAKFQTFLKLETAQIR
jgi:hypothetical protein